MTGTEALSRARLKFSAEKFGLVNHNDAPLPPVFSQVLILKEDEVVCFDTLLQVLILRGLRREGAEH
jgi:hypothetical protein